MSEAGSRALEAVRRTSDLGETQPRSDELDAIVHHDGDRVSRHEALCQGPPTDLVREAIELDERVRRVRVDEASRNTRTMLPHGLVPHVDVRPLLSNASSSRSTPWHWWVGVWVGVVGETF